MAAQFDTCLSINLAKLPTMDVTKNFFFPNKYAKKSFTKKPLRMSFYFPGDSALIKIMKRINHNVAFQICYFPIKIFTVVALTHNQQQIIFTTFYFSFLKLCTCSMKG